MPETPSPGLIKSTAKVAWEVVKFPVKAVGWSFRMFGKAVGEGTPYITTKPVKAVWQAGKNVIEHPASKPVAIGAAAVAGAVGVEQWENKREEQHAIEQLGKAQVLSQDIADTQARIAELARQRAESQAAVANPDASSNNVARLEKAEQTPTVPSLSV